VFAAQRPKLKTGSNGYRKKRRNLVIILSATRCHWRTPRTLYMLRPTPLSTNPTRSTSAVTNTPERLHHVVQNQTAARTNQLASCTIARPRAAIRNTKTSNGSRDTLFKAQFVCGTCKEEFHSRDDLVSHIDETEECSSEDTPIEHFCVECNKLFNEAKKLDDHNKRQHSWIPNVCDWSDCEDRTVFELNLHTSLIESSTKQL
jgi:hypothetical protein